MGTGCPSCKVLEKNTREAVEGLGIKANISKVTDIANIMKYGVMSTPALVINDKVVAYGRVLDSKEIKKLLK